jgi:hypothetical protein
MNPTQTTLTILSDLPGWALFAQAVLALGGPVVAWLVSFLVVGGKRGSRAGRAGVPFAHVALFVALAVGLLRLAGWMAGVPGGPAGWQSAWNTALAAPAGLWANWFNATGWSVQLQLLPRSLAFPVAGFAGLVAVPISIVAAFIEKSRTDAPDYRVPYAGTVASVTFLAAVLGIVSLNSAYSVAADRLAIDLAAAMPSVLVCLGFWALSRRDPEAKPAAAAQTSTAAPEDRGDIVGEWRSVGALPALGDAVFVAPATNTEGGTRESVDTWRAVGASGPPPRALEQIAAELEKPGQAWVIGELPDPSEVYFIAALVLLAAQERGIPSLVLTDDPKGLCERVDAALRAAGAWRYGPLVAGEAQLRLAIEQGRMPAAAFVDLSELSARAIRTLWNCLTPPATPWTRTLGLVVVSRVDRGSPLEVTHRLFTLRRLAMALAAGGARYSVLATGVGGVGTTSLVDKAFPPLRAVEVPFGARATAPVKVWGALSEFVNRPGDPWAKRAARPLVDHLSLAVAVADPTGSFDASVALWGGEMPLRRHLTLEGSASIGLLDIAWLVAGWRALRNRVPLADGTTHHALWAWTEGPATRFLLADDTLRRLDGNGRLPNPRALAGEFNKFVARAHLEAALREGRQDTSSLAGHFGRSLTEGVLKQSGLETGHSLRRTPAGDTLVRVATVPSRSGSQDEVLRDTVTQDAIDIVARAGHRRLARCDRETAAVRYYPGRVFSHQDARYEVRQQQLDEKRGQLMVDAAPPGRLPTRPDIQVALQVIGEDELPQEVRAERRVYQLATWTVRVTEKISRYYHADGTSTGYAAPVEATYVTRVRAILFPKVVPAGAMQHLAACLDHVLQAHLLAADEDIHVIPVPAGLHQGLPAGVAVVDRHVGGMGVAEALDQQSVEVLLQWTRAILQTCACNAGCAKCTPQPGLRGGPNKAAVLELLGA